MRKLNHHTWHKVDYAFKTWRCPVCGCVRYWDMTLERIVFIQHGKQLYGTPPCFSAINCEPVFKNKNEYPANNK